MKKSVMLLVVALLLAGALLAPVDQGTAHADSDTDTDDTADEPDGDDEPDADGDEDQDEDQDEDEDQPQYSQTETTTFNTSGINDPQSVSVPLIYDNSVSGEDTTEDTTEDTDSDTDSEDATEDTDDDTDSDTDSEDATGETDEDGEAESEGEEDQDADEDDDELQDDQIETKTSNASIIHEPKIGSILLIHDSSVSGEDVRQMKNFATDLRIAVTEERIDFDSRYLRGLDTDDVKDVDYVIAISRDVSGLDALIDCVATEDLLLNGKEVIISSAVDKRVLEQHSMVLQKEASPDLIILTDLKDSELAWGAALSSLVQKRPVTETLDERDAEFSTVDDRDLDEIPAYRGAVTDTIIKVSESNIPLETLKLLLLLPFAATIVAIFRNIIGTRTYGVFGPAIMSIAFLSSGLTVGLILFAVLLITGIFARRIIERLNLMMVPRLAILLTVCCMVMATIIAIGIKMDTQYLARLTVFPLIILALIIENFMKTTVEKGLFDALKICFGTVIVSVACFLVVSIPTLQAIVMTHPEILLLVVGLNILIGRWKGLRLLEYLRFSKIMKG
ncbi:MAG: 7TM domain-containing protein [Euryarchaeota archaeon]|nr:7TM domain-containing protein [Euryarchaeota archaeon]